MTFTDHVQRNRFELKYLIDKRCARAVRDFVRCHLVHDAYAQPRLAWAYPIYSIYLDSAGLSLFNATVAGHKNRFKLRARYYDDQAESPVFLEVKRRVNDVILKERSAVKRSSVKRLLAGAPPGRDDLFDPVDPEALNSLQHFCHLRHSVNADGRTIVAYEREAWVARDNDDVRITFDRKIGGAWFDPSLPVGDALFTDRRWICPPIDGIVLELKFTSRHPRWMKELIDNFDLYRVCMAKYVNCVMALGPRAPGLWRQRRHADRPTELRI